MKQTAWVRKTHRWLGLFFSLSVLLSSGSGILHNIMTRTQSPPPPARPTGGGIQAPALQVSIPNAMAKLPLSEKAVHSISIRLIAEEPWYQFILEGGGKPHYVSAKSGIADDPKDEVYASEIASRFLDGKQVRLSGYLTAFNNEYLNIFRILPVYRFDADDNLGTRVYVSTITGSVTRHTDNRRQLEAWIFTNLHKFGFIPNKDLRDLVLTLLTLGVFAASCFGIYLFFLTRSKSK